MKKHRKKVSLATQNKNFTSDIDKLKNVFKEW